VASAGDQATARITNNSVTHSNPPTPVAMAMPQAARMEEDARVQDGASREKPESVRDDGRTLAGA